MSVAEHIKKKRPEYLALPDHELEEMISFWARCNFTLAHVISVEPA